MHAHRTRLAAAAAVLALAAPLTAASTADAGVQERRVITIEGVRRRPDNFFAKGEVTPPYAERNAVMQRKLAQPGPVARRLPLPDRGHTAATASGSSRCGASARSATA